MEASAPPPSSSSSSSSKDAPPPSSPSEASSEESPPPAPSADSDPDDSITSPPPSPSPALPSPPPSSSSSSSSSSSLPPPPPPPAPSAPPPTKSLSAPPPPIEKPTPSHPPPSEPPPPSPPPPAPSIQPFPPPFPPPPSESAVPSPSAFVPPPPEIILPLPSPPPPPSPSPSTVLVINNAPPLPISTPSPPQQFSNNNVQTTSPSSRPLPPPKTEILTPPSIPSSTSTSPSIPSSTSSSPPQLRNDRTTLSKGSTPSSSSSPNKDFVTGAISAGSVAALIVIIAAAVLFVLKKRRKKIHSSDYKTTPNGHPLTPDMYYKPPLSFRGNEYHQTLPDSGVSMSRFTYEELKVITNGFSQENLLGEGGFGRVYKGCLSDGKYVAVKQLKIGSGQGDREFKAEVEIISRVHHRHLVSLVGYCIDEHHRLLAYEYLPNKTLEYHLHGSGLPVLEWSNRLKIALGSARGLAYLHEDCHPRIIHRDIKSANILLDDSFEAQVADFGLAKLANDALSHVSTRVMGTFGYMAPEYASSGKLTDRSDVFSFGVVLLELITGRRPVDPSQPLGDESLVEWVRPLLVHALETGDCSEFVDPRLENNYVKNEMLLMIEAAAACVRHAASKRPRMVQVVRALDNEGGLSDLSNGMKFGQSTVYNSAQYSAEIRLFHQSGNEGDEYSSSEFDSSSGEHKRTA